MRLQHVVVTLNHSKTDVLDLLEGVGLDDRKFRGAAPRPLQSSTKSRLPSLGALAPFEKIDEVLGEGRESREERAPASSHENRPLRPRARTKSRGPGRRPLLNEGVFPGPPRHPLNLGLESPSVLTAACPRGAYGQLPLALDDGGVLSTKRTGSSAS